MKSIENKIRNEIDRLQDYALNTGMDLTDVAREYKFFQEMINDELERLGASSQAIAMFIGCKYYSNRFRTLDERIEAYHNRFDSNRYVTGISEYDFDKKLTKEDIN